MAKIKHISGAELDGDTLKRISKDMAQFENPPIEDMTKILAKEFGGDALRVGVTVPEEQIKAAFKKIPWWKRWFMFSKERELERAKIILDLITRKQNEQ